MATRKTGKQERMLHSTRHLPHRSSRSYAIYPEKISIYICSNRRFHEVHLAVSDEKYRRGGNPRPFNKQSAIFGNPRRIISDQGSAFTSHDFRDFCVDEGIEHILITSGTPRENEQIERINRTLITLLTKLAAPQSTLWHKYVTQAQRYLNHIPSRNTGMTSFYFLFGTGIKLREDPQIKEILEAEEAIIFQEKRDQIRKEAREKFSKIQAENKRSYNKK